MIGVVLRYGAAALTSRFGLAVIVAGLLFLWHVQDRRQAVQSAVDGLVSAAEHQALKSERDAMRRQIAAAEDAARALQERVKGAEQDARRFAAELEAYERETEINPDCRVDPALLERLRSD